MKAPVERFSLRKNDEVVVVKLWEMYLRYSSDNLLDSLCQHSLDSAPFGGAGTTDRLTFRFERTTWDKKVKGLLYKHRVPVSIQLNPLNPLNARARVAQAARY
jgi:hypothetical protein